MPPRKKQKTAAQKSEPTASSDAGTSSSSAIVPSWKGTKHRRTSLEKFIDGPVDIVVEVLSLLHPRDLFTLVRTSSVFKNFLLSKSRRQLWKTVIANAPDLPPQPRWLSEPAFVHLLYSTHCHHCGTVSRRVITQWFTRACPKCIPEISVVWADAWKDIRAQGQQRGRDLSKLFDMMTNGKQPSYMTPQFMGSEQAYRCLTADVNEYVKQLRKIKKKPDQKEREKAYLGIIGEWGQRRKRRQQYSALFKAWFQKEERNRIAELGDKRDQRFAEILKRLQGSEWAKEMHFLTPEEIKEMATFPVVRRSCKLTAREWSDVLAALDDFLKKTRERRLSAERKVVIRARLCELKKAMLEHYVQLPRTAAMDVRPDFVEFALMPKCKALANAPVERTITSEDFLAILPDLHKKWQTTSKTQLVKAVQPLLRKPTLSITTRDPLDLAITVFVCERCAPFACMRYPEVLAHHCGYFKYDESSDWEDTNEPKPEDVYTTAIKGLHLDEDIDEEDYVWWVCERFSPSNVVGAPDMYLRDVLEPMRTIVRALGLDPSTATAADLEACDTRLSCKACVAKGSGDMVYSWDAALLHLHQFHRGRAKWEWQRVRGAKMDKVRELEAARDARPLLIHPTRTRWACSLCVDWDAPGNKIETHLSEQHGLSDPDACVQDGTVYVHPAKNTTLMRPPVSLHSAEEKSLAGPENSV